MATALAARHQKDDADGSCRSAFDEPPSDLRRLVWSQPAMEQTAKADVMLTATHAPA